MLLLGTATQILELMCPVLPDDPARLLILFVLIDVITIFRCNLFRNKTTP